MYKMINTNYLHTRIGKQYNVDLCITAAFVFILGFYALPKSEYVFSKLQWMLRNLHYGDSMAVFLCKSLKIDSNAWRLQVLLFIGFWSWKPKIMVLFALYINKWTLQYVAYEWFKRTLLFPVLGTPNLVINCIKI